MSFDVLMMAAGLLVGWFRRGSIWNLPNIRLRWIWVLPVAYLLQHFSIADLTGPAYEVAVLVSYGGLIAFCAVNLRVPGVAWGLGGTVANLLTLSVNGLHMPAYMPVVRVMDRKAVPSLLQGEYGKSIAMSPHTHLNFLGDIFYFKVPPASLLSLGDILLAIGMVMVIQYAMRISRESVDGDTTVQPAG